MTETLTQSDIYWTIFVAVLAANVMTVAFVWGMWRAGKKADDPDNPQWEGHHHWYMVVLCFVLLILGTWRIFD